MNGLVADAEDEPAVDIGAGTPREAVAGGNGCNFVLVAPAGAVLVAQIILIVSEDGEPYHFRRAWIRDGLKAGPDDLRILHVEGDSMEPTLTERDVVLVDTSRTIPTPPGIFVLFDGMGLVAKRLEHIPNSDPPMVRIISDNARYSAYERTADEINIVGRIRWFAREM